jgi:transcriptional regulator with XRE-family HTH domain
MSRKLMVPFDTERLKRLFFRMGKSRNEIAREFGISTQALQKWIASGRVPQDMLSALLSIEEKIGQTIMAELKVEAAEKMGEGYLKGKTLLRIPTANPNHNMFLNLDDIKTELLAKTLAKRGFGLVWVGKNTSKASKKPKPKRKRK